MSNLLLTLAQAEEVRRQAAVERLRSEAEAAGQAYLVARCGHELDAIRHGMESPSPFRLQYFDIDADHRQKEVRVYGHTNTRTYARTHANTHTHIAQHKCDARTFVCVRRISRHPTRRRRRSACRLVNRTAPQPSKHSSHQRQRSSCQGSRWCACLIGSCANGTNMWSGWGCKSTRESSRPLPIPMFCVVLVLPQSTSSSGKSCASSSSP